MSKLTRSVIYLNESDRPKKVEPLSFSSWFIAKEHEPAHGEWSEYELNKYANQYATYLQEFSAEEVGVEFTHCLQTLGMNFIELAVNADRYNSITYIGKFTNSKEIVFDLFKCDGKSKDSEYLLGKLNSGLY